MRIILRMYFAKSVLLFPAGIIRRDIRMSHPLQYFLECRKDTGVGYVLSKQGVGGGWVTRKLVPRATPRAYSLPPSHLELSSVFQQLSEHLARVREEGNKRQIALSTHLAPKAP